MIFQAFGTITNPFLKLLPAGSSTSKYLGLQGEGLIVLGNNLVKFAIVVAGLYGFINFIIAGYTFLSSPEPKEIARAWAKIWQGMLGLLVIAGSFVLAAIFGYIIFGNPLAILQPTLYGP